MTFQAFQVAVAQRLAGFSALPIVTDGNVEFTPPASGYVETRWPGGAQGFLATGLEGGPMVVGFEVYGSKGSGDGTAVSAAQELVDLFRSNPQVLGVTEAQGHANLLRHAIDIVGRDQRGFYRVDVSLIFANFTNT